MIDSNRRCSKGAAICLEHPDNASTELKSWLASNKVKYTVGMIMAGSTVIDYPTVEVNKIKATETNKKDKPTRDMLQKGEASKSMTDDEIVEFFTQDMIKKQQDISIQPIPKGEPVFIFCIFQGKQGPVQAFIDSGANCWLALDGVPQNELTSVKIEDGPIPLGVASGMTAYATAEWASLIPLADGTHQCVRGLTMERVTAKMPKLNLVPAFESIKAQCKQDKKIQNLKVPRIVGGEVQMIIGIKYQNIFPVPIMTLPNGLTVFESKLKPTAPGLVACIGGPVECLEHLCGIAGTKSTLSYMSNLVQNMKDFRPRIDFFPTTQPDFKKDFNMIDRDIPGIEEFLNDEENWSGDDYVADDEDDVTEEFNPDDDDAIEPVEDYAKENMDEVMKQEDIDEMYGENLKQEIDLTDDIVLEDIEGVELLSNYATILDIESSDEEKEITHETNEKGSYKCVECGYKHEHEKNSMLVQSEIERFMKLQDAGLDISYKCPKCRSCKDCLKGAGHERLSMKEEREQCIIQNSVRIDIEKNRAVARLAFTADPTEYLNDNSYIAVKRLQNVCRKYQANIDVKEMIIKGFQKTDRSTAYPALVKLDQRRKRFN